MSPPVSTAFDYTTVGHVTIDVLSDGSRRPGGTAFYAALQAARLGRRARIVTQGVVAEIEQLLEPFASEFELEIHPATHTTTLETVGAGHERRQRLLAWAGPIEEPGVLDSAIVHLAPVARETPAEYRGGDGFLGLTPQGLLREWSHVGAEITSVRGQVGSLAGMADRCRAIVLSELERAGCAELIAAARSRGAIVAVTDEASPALILPGTDGEFAVPVPAVDHPREDLGAGDVFAAAFFLALHEGRSPGEAAAFANATAAVRISGAGADAVGDSTAVARRLQAVSADSRPLR
jgi:hypothetical protein